MKTNAENLRLFKEARSLREDVRSGLRNKVTNQVRGRSEAPRTSKDKICEPERERR